MGFLAFNFGTPIEGLAIHLGCRQKGTEEEWDALQVNKINLSIHS